MSDDPLRAIRQRADYKACRISAELRFHGVGSVRDFVDYGKDKVAIAMMPELFHAQILSERDPATRARDQGRGVVVLTSREEAEYARRLDIEVGKHTGPLSIQVTNVRNEARAAIKSVLVGLADRGIARTNTVFNVEVEAPIPADQVALDATKARPGFLVRTLRAMGLAATPPEPTRLPPYIAVAFETTLHGVESSLTTAASDLRAALAGVRKIHWFTAEMGPSPLRLDADQPEQREHLSWEQRIDIRQPLPPVGAALMQGFIDVGEALKRGDRAGAFRACDGVISAFKDSPDAVVLLLANPQFSMTSVRPRFPGTKPGPAFRALEASVATMKKRGDMAGLCDLFFELAPGGIVDSVRDSLNQVAAGYQSGRHYEAAVRSVLGDPRNAIYHFAAFERDHLGAVPERIRQVIEDHRREIDAMTAAIAENAAAEAAEAARAGPEEAPEEESPRCRF